MHTARCAIAVGFAVSSFAVLAGQDPQAPAPPRFRVSIEVVRIDAVVTDRDGRVVPDLTATDFQVFQDGKPQKVTFAQFVPVLAAQPSSAPPRPAAKDAPAPVPVVPAPPVKRENIQRTLVVVVDDLGLSVESLSYTKRALHGFVDRELQPSDLVAIIRTGGTSDTLQAFTTDPRILHAAVDGLRWNGFSRSGVESSPRPRTSSSRRRSPRLRRLRFRFGPPRCPRTRPTTACSCGRCCTSTRAGSPSPTRTAAGRGRPRPTCSGWSSTMTAWRWRI